MSKCIQQDLICRNNNFDVLENGIPEMLFSPSIHSICTTEKLNLYGTYLRFDVLVLLVTE
jgi:hypothetical protein